MDITFFATPSELREWYERNHDSAPELILGFYKKATGKPSVTQQEALDEALCFGWIDAVRHRIDDEVYTNRYVPRKKSSVWSDINMKRVEELKAEGRMHPAGIKAYETRDPKKQKTYSNENEWQTLPPEFEAQFKAVEGAWEKFEAMPKSYQRPALWWVMSAKQEKTRQSRLQVLIENSAKGLKIPYLRRPNDPQG